MISFILGTFFAISTWALPTTPPTQQYLSHPRFEAMMSDLHMETCMTKELRKQWPDASSKRIYWTPIMPEDLDAKVQSWLEYDFCFGDQSHPGGYCAKNSSFRLTLTTSQDRGWKVDQNDGTLYQYFVYAQDMARYVTLTSNDTGETLAYFDLNNCRSFFGLK